MNREEAVRESLRAFEAKYGARLVAQCGVCMKEKEAGVLHRQYGGLGVWYVCDQCFATEDRQLAARRNKMPEPKLKEQAEEALQLDLIEEFSESGKADEDDVYG